MDVLAAAAASDAIGVGLVLTTFGLGLRHGIDWDHIAAIGDIAGSQQGTARALGYATLYAIGHGLVVFVIGVAVIVFGERLPEGVDLVMERFVGATLVLLGGFVLIGLVRDGRDFRMRSRWMLVFAGVRRSYRWLAARRLHRVEVVHDHEHPADEVHLGGHQAPVPVGPSSSRQAPATRVATHRHVHRHAATLPADPFRGYGRATSFGVGMIHGVGAETPTQVLLFLTAAGIGGPGAGVLLLGVFLLGLLLSNTVIAVVAALGLLTSSRNFAVYATLSIVTGASSLLIGALFLLGRGAVLPAFFSG